MTLRDVAASAGVSPATVSLALRGDPRIAAETRAQVEAAARRLDYRLQAPGRPRRRAGDGPRPRRANRVALLAAGTPRAFLNSPVYMDVLHGVEEAVQGADKTFLLRHLPPATPVPAEIFPQKVDGVILFNSCPDPRIRKQLGGIPCVQIMGAAETGLPWDHVTYDNSAVGALAARYLLDRGHRHLAVFLPVYGAANRRSTALMQQRAEGFARSAPETAVLRIEDGPAIRLTSTHQEADRDTIARVAERLATARPRPTAIFCPQDLLTIVLQPALAAHGLQPGRDIDIVSCNNEVLLLQGLHPRPATVDIHSHEVGRRAVEQLLWRLEHTADSPARVELAPTMRTGEA